MRVRFFWHPTLQNANCISSSTTTGFEMNFGNTLVSRSLLSPAIALYYCLKHTMHKEMSEV